MRKALFVLTLAIVTVIASAGDAFAQRRGGYNGGRSGVSLPSIGSGYYGNYGNYGNYGYYSNPYRTRSYYTTPYYYGPSQYYDPVVPSQIVRDSYYPELSTSAQAATVVVLVPNPNAQIWFNGALTSQQGMDRTFVTTPLAADGSYSYTIRARWTENGQSVQRERQVNVQPGRTSTVSFRGTSAESLPFPNE